MIENVKSERGKNYKRTERMKGKKITAKSYFTPSNRLARKTHDKTTKTEWKKRICPTS